MPRLRPKPADPSQQWLVLEPNRIEKQYWKDLWRYRELFAILDPSSRSRRLRSSWWCSLAIPGVRQFRRMEKRFADVI